MRSSEVLPAPDGPVRNWNECRFDAESEVAQHLRVRARSASPHSRIGSRRPPKAPCREGRPAAGAVILIRALTASLAPAAPQVSRAASAMVSNPLTDRLIAVRGRCRAPDSPMLIVCPSCATSYDVELASLRPTDARCAARAAARFGTRRRPDADKLLAAAEAIAPAPVAEPVLEDAGAAPPHEPAVEAPTEEVSELRRRLPPWTSRRRRGGGGRGRSGRRAGRRA